MPAKRSWIDRLAGAVASRSPIDWEAEVRKATSDEERELIEELRLVDNITALHRRTIPPSKRLGDFEIVGEIGRGAMGVVYEAIQISLERRVALKVLPSGMTANPTRLLRFQREAKALAALDHPNIVTVHTVESVDDVRFLTMELVRGKALSELIAPEGLPLEAFLDFAIPMADALCAAHDQGITHRDLKPANIMINTQGRVKILDFGLAKLHRELTEIPAGEAAADSVSLTQDGAIIGTAAYMSPEQIQGKPVDHRSDLFSLGIIFYEMATGQRPFGGTSHAEVADTIKHHTPQSITDLSPHQPVELGRIIRHCLQKDPERRYQTAKDLRNELDELRVDVSESGSGTVVPAPVPPRRVRSMLAVAALATGALLVLWFASSSWRSKPELGPSPPSWTSRQVTSDPGWEAVPALSPDGALIAYASDREGSADIWVTATGGGKPLRLTTHPATDTDPAWFPDGSAIAFVSDRAGTNSIWKVGRLGGSPILLVPDAEDPAISPDGERIAFSRIGTSEFSRILVAPVDDPSRATVLTDDQDGLWHHGSPAWSPDGASLCYRGFRDLWIVPAAGGEARRLTTEHAADRNPVWSAAGRFVYFDSAREDLQAIWRVDSTTGDPPTRLTLGTGPESHPSTSLNGRQIAYSTFWTSSDIEIVDLTSGERTRVPGSRSEMAPAFASDGSRFVFSSDRENKSALWVQTLVNGTLQGTPRRLTDHPGTVSTSDFSPDGRWVAYGRVLDEQRDVWVLETEGGLPMRFTEHPGVDLHPAWSPDGTRLAFVSDRDGGHHLWIREIANGRPAGEAKQLTSGDSTDYFPCWSPDGSRIAYTSARGDVWEIWVVTADGRSPPRQLTSGAGGQFARWDPRGAAVWVSGYWGADRLEVRRVDLRDGAVSAPAHPVVMRKSHTAGPFDISADGTRMIYVREEIGGDIWTLKAQKGSF